VPEAVVFATKPDLGWQMLRHAVDLGLPVAWIVGDTVYGHDPDLRRRIAQEVPAVQYVLAVPATEPLWQVEPPAARPAAAAGHHELVIRRRGTGGTAAAVATGLPPGAWRRIVVAAGTKGPRVYDWAAARLSVGEAGWASETEQWLLVRRSVAEPQDLAYYLSNAAATTPLGTLARVAAARWPIEQCFEEAKGRNCPGFSTRCAPIPGGIATAPSRCWRTPSWRICGARSLPHPRSRRSSDRRLSPRWTTRCPLTRWSH